MLKNGLSVKVFSQTLTTLPLLFTGKHLFFELIISLLLLEESLSYRAFWCCNSIQSSTRHLKALGIN